MVSASARRQQVAFVNARGLSCRRACALFGVARSSLAYTSKRAQSDEPIIARMRSLSAQYPRFGYRFIRVFLQREGVQLSTKRAHRLWRVAVTAHVGRSFR